MRLKALHDPSLLNTEAEDFESVPASQIIAGVTGRGAAGEMPATGIEVSDVASMWKPAWLAAPQSFELPVFQDMQGRPQTMAEQLKCFRKKIDASLGWTGKVLGEKEIEFRAAAQAVLLFLSCT